MRKLRFVLVVILAVSVVSGALARTVTKSGIVLPLTTKPVTLTWMLGDHPTRGPFDENLFCWKEFEKRTGVHIDFQCVPEANFNEKWAAVVASRNLPDMIRVNADQSKQFGPQGAFLPLEKLIDRNTKVLKKLLTPEIRKGLIAGDGHIYAIPKLDELRLTTGWLVRGDWLKKLGLKEPATLDEYYNMLVAFRDKDPDGNGVKDTIPLTVWGKLTQLVDRFAMCYGTTYEKETTPWLLLPKEKKAVYTPTSDQMKETLQFLNKLYKEGLLDKEFASNISTTAGQAKVLTNRAGATLCWMTTIRDFNMGAKASGKIPDFHVIGIAPPKGPRGECGVPQRSAADPGQCVAFSSKLSPAAAEVAIKWFDYRYSPEGILLNSYGVEGVTFNYVDGKPRHTETILNDPKGRAMTDVLSLDYGLLMPNNPYVSIIIPEQYTAEVREAWKKCEGKYVPVLPSLPYTVDEAKKVGTVMATIAPKQEEWMVQFISGQKNFTEWDNFKAAMKQMGIDDVMKCVNDAYLRYLKMK
ncbi:MAG: extracellular solute-binding protein [Bacteroidota bacterium]